MQYPTVKYIDEQNLERHPGTLVWPGINGLPVLGPISVEDSDLSSQAYTIVSYFYYKLFDLSNSEDSEYFTWVRDRIINGWFIQYHLEYIKDEKNPCNIKVYMEWVQRYIKIVKQSAPVSAKSPGPLFI